MNKKRKGKEKIILFISGNATKKKKIKNNIKMHKTTKKEVNIFASKPIHKQLKH